ncbi:hypothetical protein EJ02DRAFT_466970 [Clathrospora elynae]|uniref:Zn(2)-C6 fungal-type domain-containing protein n=1 Tax=Clathrospora elynae TaxID=706981 RepID=A0A6A5SMR6_9PLEO|nr:hypothetical protein EJ02DRAFT_466970 [Clathrospora elynae]
MSSDRASGSAAKRQRLGERTMLACTGCKQRKLKCDGQKPKCQNCIRSNRDCLVEDPATGLQRPRDYLQCLEARVAYLESLLQQTRPEEALDHWGATRVPDSSLDDFAHSREAHDGKIDHLSADVALLCLSAAGREAHYFGPSCAVSFSRVVSATMGLPKRGATSQQAADAQGSEAQGPEVQRTVHASFPSRSLAATLSQAYFRNVHSQYPFLHKPSFQVWEEACTRANQAGHIIAAGQLPLFFVLMVYAIGSLALGTAHRDSAEAYYAMALDHQAPVLELDSLESIQSILCCAVYSIKSPVGVSLWKISGMAIRNCIELGYHRNVARYRRSISPLVAEMSTRCFWVAYDIDRVAAILTLLSSILGRPVGIPDDAIDVALPLDLEDDFITKDGLTKPARTSLNEPPTYMTGAIHVIKLRRLWSKFADTLYPTPSKPAVSHGSTKHVIVDALRKELEDWYSTLPELVDYSGAKPLSVFASKVWFQIAYDHSILLLYRHYITCTLPQTSNTEEIVEKAFEECAQRARDMCLLYRKLYQNPTIQFTWGSLHILFLGGLTYLYCLWKSKRVRRVARQSDVINTCFSCNTVLVIIAERWSQATTYRDIFEDLSEKTIRMICDEGQLIPSAAVPAPSFEPTFTTSHESVPQESFMNSETIAMTGESEWFVHELLNDIRDFQQSEAEFDGFANFTADFQ